ncbi:MAG: YggS family pyridoxal phosphate-dependent enzyme [Nitrospiraceae bacterium]
MSDVEELARRIGAIRREIDAAARRVGRDPQSVRLLAATKTVSAERLTATVAAGLTLFGENRLQEALEKRAQLESVPQAAAIEWHFIGQLQRRKVRQVVGQFVMIHSIDSVELAEEIQRRSEAAGLRQSVLLEVNVGDEASKAGVSVTDAQATALVMMQMPNVHLDGLMAIPPVTQDAEAARPYFRRLRECAQVIREAAGGRLPLPHLSMGMSHDYVVAVEEGATIVRVGTGIFGSRTAVVGSGVSDEPVETGKGTLRP